MKKKYNYQKKLLKNSKKSTNYKKKFQILRKKFK